MTMPDDIDQLLFTSGQKMMQQRIDDGVRFTQRLVDELKAEGADEDVPPLVERWSCKTERDAIFALDVIATHRERIARWEANTAAEIERLKRELQSAEDFFVPELERWALEHLPKKGRSIHLPSGTLSFRKVPGGFRIVDKDAVRAWAERCLPLAIVAEVVERLDVDRIREHHKETGEVPEGADLVDDTDRFYVKG